MTDLPNYHYDLFISYASMDRAWVDGYLVPGLGLPADRIITKQSFRPGASVIGEFERAVKRSHYTLLVLSPAYLSDEWSKFGEQLASHASVAEQRDRLIPLLKEKCELPLRIDFRVRLDCTDEASWEAETIRLRDLLDQPEPTPEPIPCPYPGMVPFSAKDARFFYGREAEIKQMLQHLRHQRFLFVIGPSGSGKSSLILAGLLPHLEQSIYFPKGFWLTRDMRPGTQPLRSLAQAIGGDPAQPTLALAELLAATPQTKRLLLVVDQFEELFTQTERSEQSQLIAALKALRAVGSCALLVAMRADFYPDLMNCDLWPIDPSQRLEIAPLRGQALRQAFQQPAADMGVYLEAGLMERLLGDAADEPGVLPLLQETMVLLWTEMRHRLLPLSAYNRLGGEARSGLAVALATKADATLAELSSEQKAIARRIFLRLVQFGEGRADTRRQQSVAKLRSASDDHRLFDQTLRHLANNRLLTLSGAEKGADKKVDIAHEGLIGDWSTLRDWIAERRQAEQTRRRLVTKSEEWVRLGRGEGGLLDAAELAEAERWLRSSDAAELGYDADLPNLAQASWAAIRKAEEEKEAARQRELKQAQALAEERRQRLAETERLRYISIAQALAAQAPRQMAEFGQHERAALLARQAYLFNETRGGAVLDQIDAGLRAVLVRPCFAVALTPSSPNQGGVSCLAYSSDGRQLAIGRYPFLYLVQATGPGEWRTISDSQSATAVAFGPDDDWLAWGTWDGKVRLKNLRIPEASIVKLGAHESRITSVAFAPNGKTLASAGGNSVRLWSLAAPGRPLAVLRSLEEEGGEVSAVAFSPDGSLLVSSASDRRIRLWDTQSPEQPPRLLQGTQIWAQALAFGPDFLLAAAGDLGRLELWDLSTDPPRGVARSAPMAETVAFSPDGRFVAVAGMHGYVEMHDLQDPNSEPEVLRGHTSEITQVAFASHGTQLASASHDGTVRIWDLRAPEAEPVVRPRDQAVGNSVYCVACQGDLIAVSFDRGNVHLFHIREPLQTRLELHGDALGPIRGALPIDAVAFVPERNALVTGHQSGATWFWDLDQDPPHPVSLAGQKGWVGAVAVSPDGALVASCGGDGRLRLWESRDKDAEPRVVQVLPEKTDRGLQAVAFSPSAPVLAVGGDSGGTFLLCYDSLEGRPQPVEGHAALVHTLAFSPDGRHLASGGEDRKARVLDLETNHSFELIHEGGVMSVAFSHDGNWLATGSKDGVIRLWDIRHPNHPAIVLRGHDGMVSSVVFTVDGKRLISGGWDGTVRLWIPWTRDLADMVCAKVWRNLSRGEWHTFVGEDVPYELTCPALPPGS